eukprot:3372392-Prymnesium_polylepis.1
MHQLPSLPPRKKMIRSSLASIHRGAWALSRVLRVDMVIFRRSHAPNGLYHESLHLLDTSKTPKMSV